MRRHISPWISGSLALGVGAVLFWLERKRPLRRPVEPTLAREARNLAIAAAATLAVQMIERPVVRRVTAIVERRRLGLLARLSLPRPLDTILALALLDYTLYLWHILTHRIGVLWRLHSLHHADVDLSTTTALRFHFGEMAVSTLWRCAQVAAIGVSDSTLAVWELCVLVSILFHHSNVRLPAEVDRALARFIVTPRLHGIHHSDIADEMASNWSSGLTLWDRLHGTLRLDVPQDRIRIGLPAETIERRAAGCE